MMEETESRFLSRFARLSAARASRRMTRAVMGRSSGRNGGGGGGRGGGGAGGGVAVLARMGIARIGVIELMFLFAPLVIVPLGMELGRVGGFESGVARSLAS